MPILSEKMYRVVKKIHLLAHLTSMLLSEIFSIGSESVEAYHKLVERDVWKIKPFIGSTSSHGLTMRSDTV